MSTVTLPDDFTPEQKRRVLNAAIGELEQAGNFAGAMPLKTELQKIATAPASTPAAGPDGVAERRAALHARIAEMEAAGRFIEAGPLKSALAHLSRA